MGRVYDPDHLFMGRILHGVHAADLAHAIADLEAERDAVLDQLRSEGAEAEQVAIRARPYAIAIAELNDRRDHSIRHADWAGRKLNGD